MAGAEHEDTEAGGSGEAVIEDRLQRSFERMVHEGTQRLERDPLALLSTGTLAGLEVGLGILALLVVDQRTHDALLGGVAFSLGFMALLLAHSELFTEGFLVPVITVAARQARARRLLGFWAGSLAGNLFGGWVMMWLVLTAFPAVGPLARHVASQFIDAGFGVRPFTLTVLAGAAMTLMTRMQHGTDSVVARLAAAVGTAFLLAGLPLFHSVLDSLIIFAALDTTRTAFGYLHWLEWLAFAATGNLVGGVGLVTLLRLMRARKLVLHQREASRQRERRTRRPRLV